MNPICPNLSNKEVAAEFNELVAATSEKAAYHIWSQNNGNGIDKAPNGEPSILFKNLLEHYNGDRLAAIQAKAKVFTNSFKSWFGDWLSDDKTNVSKVVDKNGEPLIVWHSSNNYFNTFSHEFGASKTGARDSKNLFFFMRDRDGSRWYSSDILHNDFKHSLLNVDNFLAEAENELFGNEIGKFSFKEPLFDDNRQQIDELNYSMWIYDNGLILSDEDASGYWYPGMNRLSEMTISDVNTNADFNYLSSELVDAIKSKITKKYNEDLLKDLEIVLKYKEHVHSHYDESSGVILDQDLNFRDKIEKWFVRPFFLNIKNIEDASEVNTESKRKTSLIDFVEHFDKDGFIVKDTYDSATQINPTDIYAVRNSNQIKSIDNQGTFSILDNNVYYNYKSSGRIYGPTEMALKNLGIARRLGDKLIINQNALHMKNQAIEIADELGAIIDFPTGTPFINITEYAVFTPLDSIEKSKDSRNIHTLISFLKDRFPGIKVKLVSAAELPKMGVKSNASSFIKDGVVYLVKERVTSEIAIEEMLHPLIATLLHDNPQLFEQLYEEAKKTFPKLRAEIELNYSKSLGFGLETRKNELVTQALSRYFKKSFENNETTTFASLAKLFVNWLEDIFRSVVGFFGYNIKIDPTLLKNITLEDLARIINTTDTKFTVRTDFHTMYHVEVDKSMDKIKKGIKQRLNSIKRYQKKNLDVIYAEEKLLDDLNHIDSIEGIVEFVNYVSESLADAVKFLNNRPEDINSRLLVQLKRDYLSFFIPMIKDILYLIDTTSVLEDNIEDYDAFKAQVEKLLSDQTRLMNKYDNILRSNFRSTLEQYATEHGSQTVEQMMQWLDDPSKDLGTFERFIGQSSSANNEIIRIMADILNTSINKTKRNTFDHGVSLVNLYNAAKKANPNKDVMRLFQEVDENGNTTGYFVRDLNYGKFYADQRKAVEDIIVDMGITRDEDGTLLFESKEQEKEFRKRKTQWLLKNGELKYTKEYYDLKYSLSVDAQNALDEIDNLVSNILSKYKGTELHKISAKDKANLDSLSRQKAELYSEYYADGNKKDGIDLAIAKELQAFRKKLKGKITYKKDYKRFNGIAKQVADKYGTSSPEYSAWLNAATEEVYTEEFYDNVKSLSTTKSPAMEALYEERSRLLAMYRSNDNKGIVLEIPDEIKDRVKQLDQQIDALRPVKVKGAPSVTDIADFKKSSKYYEDATAAKQEGRYEKWYADSHYETKSGHMVPVSYYTYMEPKSSKYVTRQPNSYFSMLDQNSEFANPNYDLDGEYVQPKKSLYDNSKAFRQVQKDPTIKALYDALILSMKDSYGKLSFLNNSNPYKLPLISGRIMSIISRADDKFEAMKYIVKDSLIIKDDDTEYVEKFDQRNDGSQVKLIPTRYIKMLDDPSKITSDVVGSVIQFFEMAENYQNMQDVQDDLEMMLYGIADLSIKKDKKLIQGKESNVYKKASDLLDMVLYGEKKQQFTIAGVNVTKGLQKVYSYISLSNLANNVWAIIANYATGQINLDIESIAGKYFDAVDIHFAKKEYLRRLPDLTAHIGDVNHKDKLLMLMQKNQVTRSNDETFSRLDQSRWLRGINQHFWYNGYTAGDFTIKSQLLMAVYHSYKPYKGEYLTKQLFINKYYSKDKKAGKAAFKAISETLWDAYDVVDGKLQNVAKTALKSAADKAAELALKKINGLAVRIDGNITDVDRAAIHRNVLTLFLVMHRNFMINGIQERFKAKQFNYNTQQMEGGMYADAAKFVWHSVRDGKIKFITQAMANWDALDDLEKYNVKKVSIEFANIIVWGVLISTLLVGAADDEPEDWALLASAYAATRISFEFRTLYNPFELMNLLNSPSAAINQAENAANLLKLFWIPNYFGEDNVFSKVKSGTYKGWPKIARTFMKLSPLKNVYEATSVEGIKSKRNYLENQLAF